MEREPVLLGDGEIFPDELKIEVEMVEETDHLSEDYASSSVQYFKATATTSDISDLPLLQKEDTKNNACSMNDEKPYVSYQAIPHKSNRHKIFRYNGSSNYLSCYICGCRTGEFGMENHMRTHTAEIPYYCDICGYKTNHSLDLRNHRKTHTDEKPYACRMCKFRTKHARDLRNHIMIHTGEKPYSCDKCDYRTNRSSILNVHKRTHTQARRPRQGQVGMSYQRTTPESNTMRGGKFLC
uniref:Zinc finger protein 235 n=1 Tax=Lygus hesperus TaxID=30085 RepID=A0A146LTH3_LYGHE